jgi:dTDP-4-dehydrorhamnose reductase/dTDP-4-dehydrorhamnose 3,5-epimerase
MADLALEGTPIPDLQIVKLTVHGDARGWFKENWQLQKLEEAGLMRFRPVQNNVSYNQKKGTTRGIHAEPWDKYVSVTSGSVFGAWVDLREGPNFGKSFTYIIDPSVAVFVPRGVANSFQTLEDDTTYSYLVNGHWSPDAKYTFVNLADPQLAIAWPIALEECEISEKDRGHPNLDDVEPVPRLKTVILGAEGQLGAELSKVFPNAEHLSREGLNLEDPKQLAEYDWSGAERIINAAAYTNVDNAETPEGRAEAWKVNAVSVGYLVDLCLRHQIEFVQISSDYVFDGIKETPYSEEDTPSPVNVYGSTKAAADLLVARLERHFIVRTSWLLSSRSSFVRAVKANANSKLEMKVVDDQVGRPTFIEDLAKFIKHLVDTNKTAGIYNFSGRGSTTNWYLLARNLYSAYGADPSLVSPISSDDYMKGRIAARRPATSSLNTTKASQAGFSAGFWADELAILGGD